MICSSSSDGEEFFFSFRINLRLFRHLHTYDCVSRSEVLTISMFNSLSIGAQNNV